MNELTKNKVRKTLVAAALIIGIALTGSAALKVRRVRDEVTVTDTQGA